MGTRRNSHTRSIAARAWCAQNCLGTPANARKGYPLRATTNTSNAGIFKETSVKERIPISAYPRERYFENVFLTIYPNCLSQQRYGPLPFEGVGMVL